MKKSKVKIEDVDRIKIIQRIELAINKEKDINKLKKLREEWVSAVYSPKVNGELIKKYGGKNER